MMLALAAPALAQPTSSITIRPYVQNVAKDSATICWATLCAEVTLDPPRPYEKSTAIPVYDHHSVRLSYLKPGTTYTYDLLGDGSDAGKGSFTTFPEGEHPFNFVVISDCHNQWGAPIVKRVITEQPDMVFSTGDLVCAGIKPCDWKAFFWASGELMRNAPYYPALGNHEMDAQLYFDFFALPGNERYYSFDREPAHFVVLDSQGPMIKETNQAITEEMRKRFNEERERYWQRQLAWLRDDLASNQDAKYIFVFFHHPPYTSYSKALEEALRTRQRFGTIFQDYGVSAVFNGHHHHYNHALVGGVRFIMTCAGGELLGADAPQPETLKCAKVYNYARIDVGPERASVHVKDVEGQMLDQFEIPARHVDGED